MSTTISDAAALRIIAAADELMEIRRYVKGQPDVALTMLETADARYLPETIESDRLVHMLYNFADGVRVIRSDPLILEGHLYAAARLLQSIAGRLEKGDDA